MLSKSQPFDAVLNCFKGQQGSVAMRVRVLHPQGNASASYDSCKASSSFSLIEAIHVFVQCQPALLLHRYQEIAEHAFNVIQKQAVGEGRQRQKLRHAPQPLNVFIAQEVYRVLLFSVFLAQNVVVRHVPYAGKPSNSAQQDAKCLQSSKSFMLLLDMLRDLKYARLQDCLLASNTTC